MIDSIDVFILFLMVSMVIALMVLIFRPPKYTTCPNCKKKSRMVQGKHKAVYSVCDECNHTILLSQGKEDNEF